MKTMWLLPLLLSGCLHTIVTIDDPWVIGHVTVCAEGDLDRDILMAGSDAWDQHIQLNFEWVASCEGADVRVYRDDSLLEERFLGYTQGIGQPHLNGRGGFVQTRVGLVGDEPRLLPIVIHEFGHVLGLHHSEDTLSIMYPKILGFILEPNADDIAAVQNVYGAETP